jgi:hypothetical protein
LWPTPTRELPWLQLLSRSAYKFQLAVTCSVGDARIIVHIRWVPVGNTWIWFGLVRRHTYLLLPMQSSGLCTSSSLLVITYD